MPTNWQRWNVTNKKTTMEFVTKADLLKIKIAASWIPIAYEIIGLKERGISGFNLISNKIFIDHNRKNIDATATYRQINHKNKMIAAFQRNGLNGVEEYLKKYETEIKTIVKSQENVKQQLGEIQRLANGGPIPGVSGFSKS